MSKLESVFKEKSKRILNVYCTAGYPSLDSTMKVMESLQKNGADIIELGMPYSDPLADGEVIQVSSIKALANGMNIAVLFEQIKDMRKNISIPVILMGYMNPILQYGFEAFCIKAKEVGVDGLILPDLPLFEFEQSYGKIITENNLDFIFLVTPETPVDRIKKLDSLSNGFLYAVSSSATTGKDKDFNVVAQYLQKLQAMQLKNPILVGFGIKDKATFNAATVHTQGAIIGSAYIQQLTKGGDIETTTSQFLNSVLGA
ncbi:MAG: tryptophan synthase subunit alpha [Sediminibacterium sp.]|jgi:tryptophan synthase alpha chain|nr:tryptophan synthase subunit alpha [Sediminibacterium sp.]